MHTPNTENEMSPAAAIPVHISPARGPGAARWGVRVSNPAERVLDPDYQLVEQCMAGNEAAWEELVRLHTRRVYSVCYRFTGTSEEAQDLTQEVFLRVFRTLKSFRAGEGSFSVWLNRLTRNLLIDHYRRSRLDRKTESLDDQLPRIEESGAAEARADGMLAGREASELLQEAVRGTKSIDQALAEAADFVTSKTG